MLKTIKINCIVYWCFFVAFVYGVLARMFSFLAKSFECDRPEVIELRRKAK